MDIAFDAAGTVFAIGIVFWLAGGADWVGERTRRLKLENDLKEQELQRHNKE